MSRELCRKCGGEGQTGMYRDGTPIVCKRCDGEGVEPSDLSALVDANDDPYGGGEPA